MFKRSLFLSFVALVILTSTVFAITDGVNVGVEVTAGSVPGCTDSTATNYNSSANTDDGSCTYPSTDGGGSTIIPPPPPPPPTPVYGCTDPEANNYNSNATVDDGSCLYDLLNVSNFSADPEDILIRLSWGNPSFVGFDGVRIMRKTSGFPSGPTDGTLIYDGTGESFPDTNVSTGITYYYAIFARNNANDYSSGLIDDAELLEPGEEPLPEGEPVPDPFDNFPEVESSDPLIRSLATGDFLFIQPNEPTQSLVSGGRVRVNGGKNLTIFLPYEKVPETLKTIGVTMFDPYDSRKSFSFLLRINSDKSGYTATIAPLGRDGNYRVVIHIINYEDQSLKRLEGTIVAGGTGFIGPLPELSAITDRVFRPVAVTTGVLVGGAQLLAVGTQAKSMLDFYLIFMRAIGALLGWLGFKKKTKPWGTVYDAITKRPIDPAYVVVERVGGKEAATAITDIDGRYGFFLPAGSYRLKVGKTHYEFPSKKLAGQERDELYGDLYFGETVQTSGEDVVNRNVPLDPVGFDWNEFAKSKADFFRIHSKKELIRARIGKGVYALGFAMAAWGGATNPGVLNFFILAIYLGILSLQLFWQVRYPVVAVKRQGTNEPVPFAIIRFYFADLNTEVKHVVTDEMGRFYALLRPGTYYYTVEEKMPDESYSKIYQSPPIYLKRGVILEDIYVA